MTLHVVYLVGPGDDNPELQFSLRSLVNLQTEHTVTIAGHKPTWVSGDVTHLPVVQETRQRQRNVNANLLAACDAYPEGFLMWYDDIFLMRPITEVPRMRANLLDKTVRTLTRKDGTTRYVQGIAKAGQILRDLHHPGPLYAYDAIHVPQHIDPIAMRWAIALGTAHGCNHRLTLHGNLAGYRDAVHVPNAKEPEGWAARTWVSTSDRRFRDDQVGAWIREQFPEPCRWER